MEGTPKWDSELVRISSAPALVAGRTSGMVMRRMTYHCFAPAILADSSSVGSMRSSAETTCMNTNGK